jgi:hypothetical protein
MRIGMGNEGWLALSALALFEGRPLYPGPDEFFVANYLPLSYAIYAGLHGLTGDLIMAGRWLSWLTFAGVVGAVFAVTWSMTRHRTAAALSAVLVAASFARWYAGNLGVADSQLLGHLVALAAVWVLISQGAGWRSLVAATALLLTAGLVKQTLFGFPLGMALWLWWEQPRRFCIWMLGCALAVAGIVGILFAMFGAALFENVLLGRLYSVSRWFTNMRIVTTIAVPLAASAVLLTAYRGDPRIRLVLCLILGSAIEAAALAAALGTTFAVGYDLAIAACIGAGVAVASLRDRPYRLGPYGLVSLVALAELLRVAIGMPFGQATQVEDVLIKRDRLAPEILASLSMPGEAICIEAAYCYWAGKRARVDLRMYALAFDPPRDHRPLVRRIEQREFEAIAWAGPPRSALIGAQAELRDAVEKNYRPVKTFDTSPDLVIFAARRS